MQAKVAIAKCTGHGRCAAVAPKVFVLNADGYNETETTDVPDELKKDARRGANACPERAIAVADD